MQSCLLLRQSASSASKLDPLVSSDDASLAAVREEVKLDPGVGFSKLAHTLIITW